MKEIIPELKIEHIKRLAAGGNRADGRSLGQFREMSIERDVIGTAEGSARVKLGKTDILVGVKIELGAPYPNHPDEGMLKTTLELRQIAHHSFDPGQMKNRAIELSRVVDRGVRESRMIDMKKLCIEPGKKVWMVYLDIQVLDYDGNLFDAATIGSIATLTGARVPASAFGLGEDFPLPLSEMPISTTFVKIDGHIMLDPTATEEAVADARLTVTMDSQGNLRAMQKGLSGAFYYEEITTAIENSIKTGNSIREIIRSG